MEWLIQSHTWFKSRVQDSWFQSPKLYPVHSTKESNISIGLTLEGPFTLSLDLRELMHFPRIMRCIWNGEKTWKRPSSFPHQHLRWHVSAGGSWGFGSGLEERFPGIMASSMPLFQLKTKHLPCPNKLESIQFVSGVRGFFVILILV